MKELTNTELIEAFGDDAMRQVLEENIRIAGEREAHYNMQRKLFLREVHRHFPEGHFGRWFWMFAFGTLKSGIIKPVRKNRIRNQRLLVKLSAPKLLIQSYPDLENQFEQASTVSIADLYDGKLRVSGKRAKGLCPFHKEKTPSFSIDIEENLFYCFGCHKGGGPIQFIMLRDEVNFATALKLLTEK